MKSIAINREIAGLLREFSKSVGETFYDSLSQCIIDYISILKHVQRSDADSELRNIVIDFETECQTLFNYLQRKRQDFLKRRREEAILLNRRVPSCDNRMYFIQHLDDSMHNIIKSLIKKYPFLYSKEKKATMKEVIDRSILFRIIFNQRLMENRIYREWRVCSLLERENRGKISWQQAIEKVSKARKVEWTNES